MKSATNAKPALVMCNFIRTLLTLFLAFFLTKSFSQVLYDSNVTKEYDSIYKRLPAKCQKIVKQLEQDKIYSGGVVLTQLFMDDTLNLSDRNPEKVTITDVLINGKPVKTVTDSKVCDQSIMFISGLINSDTLNIRVTPGLFSNQLIQHVIVGNQIKTTYNEYYKYDSVLRANNADTNTNDLTIPTTIIKFVLSDKNFSSDKFIYGQAEVITDAYFYLAAYGFKDNTLKHRFHFKYYFKFKPTKNST